MSLIPNSKPAKSLSESIPISEETRAIIKERTGRDYYFSHELPITLDLSDCTNLVDVSTLGNVKILYLKNCKSIKDVSALGNVQVLDLSFCTGITDVSALGNVRVLKLHCCTGIKDVSALGNAQTLDLTHIRTCA